MGREIDYLIAEKVFGWKRVGSDWHTSPGHRPSKDYPGNIIDDWENKGPHDVLISPNKKSEIYFCGCSSKGEDVPYYSSDISAAWEIVEKLRDDNFSMSIQENGTHWKVSFYDIWSGDAEAPMAICKAAIEYVNSNRFIKD